MQTQTTATPSPDSTRGNTSTPKNRFCPIAFYAVLNHSGLRGPLRCFLAVIEGKYGNASGLTWPTQESIHETTGYSVRQIRKFEQKLEALGVLRQVGVKSWGAKIYELVPLKEKQNFQLRPAPPKNAAPPRHSSKSKSADKEKENSHSLQSSPVPSVSEEPIQNREKEKAAELAAFTPSPGFPNGSEGNPGKFEAIAAILEPFPELAHLVNKTLAFVPVLRGLGVSVEDFETAVVLTMSRRKQRNARDGISSLRYFIRTIGEVQDAKTGGTYGPGQRFQTSTRNSGRVTVTPDGDVQELDWRGFPVKKHYRWNGTGYDEVS